MSLTKEKKTELIGKYGYPHGFFWFWLHDYFRFGAFGGVILPTWS